MTHSLIVTVLLFGFTSAAEPPAWRVKTIEAKPPEELSKPVRARFGTEAFLVADAEGEPVLTMWLRSPILSRATADQVKNGLTYRELPDGTLLGVVSFAKPFTDYRKQDIAAGVYTLRYALQPEVGDHMGTSPHPEFGVLVPAAKDTSDEPIELAELIKLSVQATKGDHPAVMLLFPHPGKDKGPKLVDLADGVRVLQIRRTIETESGQTELGFAWTIAGVSKSRK